MAREAREARDLVNRAAFLQGFVFDKKFGSLCFEDKVKIFASSFSFHLGKGPRSSTSL